MSISVRYPKQFELSRLEAVGDPPYLEVDEARRRYEAGQSVRVVSEGSPPAWFLIVAPQRHRFTVTYYAPSGTPLREAMWEADAGGLLCRRVIDLFYVDGDPGRRVAYAELISVTRQVSADGLVSATMASPMGKDEFRETTLASVDGFRLPEPSFGEWQPLVEAGDVGDEGRFGIDAIDAAIAFLDQSVASDALSAGGAEAGATCWRVPASTGDVLAAMDDVLADRPHPTGVPVLRRGEARIIPLAVQTDPSAGGRDAQEERRRMSALAAEIGAALEYRAGRGVSFDLTYRGVDSVAAYAAALREASGHEADTWDFGLDTGAALVWTGEESLGTLTLALHIVPASWVNERRAGIPVYGIDVRWSITDIDPA